MVARGADRAAIKPLESELLKNLRFPELHSMPSKQFQELLLKRQAPVVFLLPSNVLGDRVHRGLADRALVRPPGGKRR